MTTKTTIVVHDDGKIERHVTNITEVMVPQSALEAMTGGISVSLYTAMDLDCPELGVVSVNATFSRQSTLWSIPLRKLQLRAPFKVFAATQKTNLLTPNFTSTTDPVLELMWIPPEDMNLRFIVKAIPTGTGWRHQKCWMIAYDARRGAYCLPLANCYDDAAICTGEFSSDATSAAGTLKKCIEQLWKSRWNGDLFIGDRPVYSEMLFRFKPDTFEMAPPKGNWTASCFKISTPISINSLP